jgi:hypothetical protein
MNQTRNLIGAIFSSSRTFAIAGTFCFSLSIVGSIGALGEQIFGLQAHEQISGFQAHKLVKSLGKNALGIATTSFLVGCLFYTIAERKQLAEGMKSNVAETDGDDWDNSLWGKTLSVEISIEKAYGFFMVKVPTGNSKLYFYSCEQKRTINDANLVEESELPYLREYFRVTRTRDLVGKVFLSTVSCHHARYGETFGSLLDLIERARAYVYRKRQTENLQKLQAELSSDYCLISCPGCKYFHGRFYGEHYLVCGMHVYGFQGSDCPDQELT